MVIYKSLNVLKNLVGIYIIMSVEVMIYGLTLGMGFGILIRDMIPKGYHG